MLGVRLDQETEVRLDRVARRTGQSKSEIARQALRLYLRRAAMTPAEAKRVVAALADEEHEDQFWQGDVEGWQ